MKGQASKESMRKSDVRKPYSFKYNALMGFTLVELLVALAIFSIMSVMAYRGLNSALDTRDHLMQDNRKWRELAVFFTQMKDGMSNVVNRPVRDNGDLLSPAFIGKSVWIGEGDAQLIFTRMGFSGQKSSLGSVC